MAYLRAFGSWLPERRVPNQEIAAQLDVTPEWILDMSGIEERRYADDKTVASHRSQSLQNCLQNAGITAADLGMILVASGSTRPLLPRSCRPDRRRSRP